MISTPGTLARSEDDALLQRRVALFGLVCGLISVAGLVVRATIHLSLFNQRTSSFWTLAWGAHAFGCMLPLALWLATRRGQRSRRFVLVGETIAAWGATITYLYVGSYLLAEARSDYVVILTMNVFFVARAVYVPSTPLRTFLLTGVAGIVIVTAVVLDTTARLPNPLIPPDAPFTRGLNATVWWSFITGLCTIITATIYGLRRQVREARRLGQYVLEERMAVGGMGEVYRARHAMLRRPTAIKLVRTEVVGEQTLARFEREAQRTAALTHPNTVRIYDYGRTDDGVFYYAMELLEGADLQTIVDRTGPMPPARASRLLAQAAGALAEAHGADLVHRDIKPANLVLVERGGDPDVVKVIDFGLAKDQSDEQDGKISGTPLYVSPEAILTPNAIDARSDLYSLGAVGYYMLTGAPVFDADAVSDVFAQHVEVQPVPPSVRAPAPIPERLEKILLLCLAKDPAARPQTARELQVRLLDAAADLEPWDELDARRWWAAHREEVRAAPSEHASAPKLLTVQR